MPNTVTKDKQQAWSNSKITKFAFGDWVKQTHKCPVCKKAFTTYEDISYINKKDMCKGCMQELTREHVYADVISDMAEANDMSVADYETEMGLC